jgi:F0F1-type ATP synthase membrane subunit b/b'
METLDYFLEPAIPFGIVLWFMWYIVRDDVKDAFRKDDKR